MTSGASPHSSFLDSLHRSPHGFSESVAPIWRLHMLLVLACCIGVGSVWALDGPGRPSTITIAALVLEAAIFSATIHALRRSGGSERWWPFAVCVILSCLTAVPAYFFGPNSGFAAVIALVLVLARLFTGGWGVRSSQALAWTIYGSLALGQAAVVTLIVAGSLPDACLVPLVNAGSTPVQAVGSHIAIQVIWFGAFLLGRLLQKSYGNLAAHADDAQRAALQREALLGEAKAEYERALLAGARGVFSGTDVGGYHLSELLGRGGMGEIYDAVNAATGRRAAVKLVRSDHLRSKDVIAAFLREADVLARIDSPHVARIYDAGGLDSAVPFIAMEHLDGQPLDSLLRDKPLDSGELERFTRGIAAGLTAVHAAGIVHGDLTPRNVVRSARGEHGIWKLVDFGLATATDSDVADHCRPAGTVPFMAPELLRGEPATESTDVYGFAAVLYAAATSRSPFAARSAASTVAAASLHMPPAPLVSPGVAAVLRIGLAKDSATRFDSAKALASAMAAAINDRLGEEILARADALPAWSDRDEDSQLRAHTLATKNTGAGSRQPAFLEPTEVQSVAATSASGFRDVADFPPAPTVLQKRIATEALDADAWLRALRQKTVPVMIGFLLTCAVGIPMIAVLARNHAAMYAAFGGIGGIAVMTGVMLYRAQRGNREQLNWPWAIVAMFCAGPAYFFGLNSGFAAVLVVGLFSNGGFTTGQKNPAAFAIPVAVVGSQGVLLALILSGVIPDAGLSPLHLAGTPIWEPVFAHVLVQGIYLSAHIAGFLTDRRHGTLLGAAIHASREAAEQRAMLETARAQLRRALHGDELGAFCGHRVGDYELTALLGRGGMGEVYDAAHIETGDRVAVKLIRADRFGDRQAVRLFVREAAVLSRIDSPHVARIHDAGGDDGSIPHIVMELLEGRTLSELLRERDTLDKGTLRTLVHDVGAGLQAVHDAGVVHRDLKPQNIMLVSSPNPRWKLLDFGIAKLLDASSGVTSRNLVLGTPQYQSPEQALGDTVDARSDLYSFGQVIYRAFVGRPAYAASDPISVTQAARMHGPPDPSDYVDTPRDFECVLRIAIALAHADRFASAREMRDAFLAAIDDRLDLVVRQRGEALLARAPWARRR